MNGFNSTVFVYGQTGSGKTHTMECYEYMAQRNGRLSFVTQTSDNGQVMIPLLNARE